MCLLIWVISRLRVLWRFPSSCRYRCCAPLCLLIWVIGRLRVLLRFPSSCRCRCCAPLCLLIWVIRRLSILWCLPRSCRCRCRCSFPLRSALCIIIGDLRCSLPSRCRYRCSFPCKLGSIGARSTGNPSTATVASGQVNVVSYFVHSIKLYLAQG